ncbi:0641606f-0944-4693-9c77-29be4c8c5742 [Thermothielavioides terrestris]|uniref:0641606f-0944-4693-9c77-29be4c8c5742 n=1 Tax=Thermothielavioides terrestris TaxID=2587410 RepID=A0A3S4ATG8_9PEZI|nr:0641606f-0944-4693-9c77-29be4c8c5742 [Thermothielavioides terrestris]
MPQPQQNPQAQPQIAPVPKVGERAPTLGRDVSFPRDKPVVVVFLRHCGCPFAEKTFKLLTNFSNHHPEVHCVAVSQSSQADTDKWIVQVGGEWEVQVIIDEARDLYHAWGLGIGSTWYTMNPKALWSAWKLGTEEGIWNRAADSGSRWQVGGAFAVDAGGFVRWVRPSASADDVPDFQEALKALAGHWGMA